MATALTPTARPVTLREGATLGSVYWHRLRRALHRRAGRIEGILVVLAMLLPQMVLTLAGGD